MLEVLASSAAREPTAILTYHAIEAAQMLQ